MDNEIIENHKRYIERKNRYKGFGYDIDKERDFILEKAKPLYGKILEAGAGKGYFSLTLAKQGYSFVAFDISQEELHFAELNLAYYGVDRNVCLKVENAEHTSFTDQSFDVIFSVNTIHHLRKPYQVIDELIRLLSPKGKLVLADFSEHGFKIIDKIHTTEGKTHEVCKTTLLDVESYLVKKGFSIKKQKSVCQSVLLAEKELM